MWGIMNRSAVALAILLPAASPVAAQGLSLPDGIYVDGACPRAGFIGGETISISAGDFYGKGKDRYISFPGGLACNLRNMKETGGTFSGKLACYNRGASAQMPAGSKSLSLKVSDNRTFELSSKEAGIAEYGARAWRWCR